MFVLTVDQVNSAANPDRIAQGAEALNAFDPAIPFERTVGDEFQGVFADANGVVSALLALSEQGEWHIGLGVGQINEPLPQHSREGDGPAFRAARCAVELSKRQRAATFVAGNNDAELKLADAQALFRAMSALLDQRTDRQWELATLAFDHSGAEIANKLGITPQSVSSILKSGHAKEIDEARPVLVRLLQRANESA